MVPVRHSLAALVLCALTVAPAVRAQSAAPVNADGMALAQNNPAIDQARLLRDSVPPTSQGADAYGTALPAGDSSASTDDSMGAQQILKTQEQPRPWTLTG